MKFEEVKNMGEHKRNPIAVFFKENPWAPDFRPLLGQRRPRGKGLRRIYKIMMEQRHVEAVYHGGRNRRKERQASNEPKDKADNFVTLSIII